ncbi:hypothetical protein FRC03_010903 [Tulasnella sp. 419]|nr:hypothetical protein FRC03_010903 [Tulasnella sp. 419]
MSRSSGKGKAAVKPSLKTQKRKDSTPANDANNAKEKRQQPSIVEGLNDTSIVQPQPWAWKVLTDAVMTNHPAVFSKDSKYFFLPSASSVKIHSTATREVVSTLSATNPSSLHSASTSTSTAFDGHKDIITSIALNPHNPYQLYTASLDGCIKIWDYLEPRLLKTINLKNPIVRICAHEKLTDTLFVAVNIPEKDKERRHPVSHVLRVSWGQSPSHAGSMNEDDGHQKRRKREYSTLRVGKTSTVTGLGISTSGNWLVVLSGLKAHIANTSSLQSGFSKLTSTDHLTCLAFHPTEDYFATGDTRGQIRLWYSLQNLEELSFEKLGVEKKATTTLFHWHAHPVQSLSFTPNGAYLLSGGEESTMVIWQLDSGHKEFVPRLGAPIRSLTAHRSPQRGEEYLIGLMDGTLVTISAQTLKISWTSSRMKINPGALDVTDRPSALPPILTVHPQSRNIILPSSHPSTLQIYSLPSSSVITDLEVLPSNRISSLSKHIQTITPSRISHAVLSPLQGEWLATVDYREDEEFGLETGLKVWKWDENERTFVLNTRIDKPHGKLMVTTIEFNVPDEQGGLLLATGGQDGNIKTWSLKTVKATKKTEGEAFWVQRTSFGYRNEVPTRLTFSPDGSLLAVAQGMFITLWDASSNVLVRALTTMATKSISSFAFLGNAGRYIAASGADQIIVWDLVTSKGRFLFAFLLTAVS